MELLFRAHPEFTLGRIRTPPRIGPMCALLESDAKEAELPQHGPPRLLNTLQALKVAERVRRHKSPAYPWLYQRFFGAPFALAEGLEDSAVIGRHARNSGVDPTALHAGLADATAPTAVRESEAMDRKFGVRGRPAWPMGGGRSIKGMRPPVESERFADHASPSPW
jgi:predicted DsbA family dithiol-disulfide isomerase